MIVTGSSNTIQHWHWTSDHCAEGVPLFGLTDDDQWSDVVVGYACSECWEQWWAY